jgi:hypothetical protein
LKKLVFLSLSLLLLLILIPACSPAATPAAGTPPAIVVFSNNPATINAGGTSTLLWNVTGATSVSIDQGVGQVNVAGIKAVTPTATAIYTITATNSAGSVTKSVTTTVNSAPVVPTPTVGLPPVIVIFSSNPNSDGTSTLTWNVTGAMTVSIDQGIGQVDVAGTKVVSPTISTIYILSATNSSGTITGSAVTQVNSGAGPVTPMPFAVTNVIATSSPATFTGVCPKTFTFYATFTANGPGTATYRWERDDLRYSGIQNVTFNAAGTQSVIMQWELGETAAGYYRVHILTPSDLTSLPIYYNVRCVSP